ncbi:MAG TPA: hypothetical protein VIJ04_08125 [Xanthobacteraceae bacterium]
MVSDVAVNWQENPTTGQWSDCSTLRQVPTAAHRHELEKHADQVHQLLEQKPVASKEYAKKTFGLIAKLILAKPARSGGPETTEARVQAYEMALDDVPWWAVGVAIRKWHRGQCGQWNQKDDFNYRFAPESADLRQIAQRETYALRERLDDIDKVLRAIPYRDSTAEREKNKAAIQEINAEFGFRPSYAGARE